MLDCCGNIVNICKNDIAPFLVTEICLHNIFSKIKIAKPLVQLDL